MRETLTIETSGRGLIDITREVSRVVEIAGLGEGQCHCFIRHTSAWDSPIPSCTVATETLHGQGKARGA